MGVVRGNFSKEMEIMKSSMACPTPKVYFFPYCRTEQRDRGKRDWAAMGMEQGCGRGRAQRSMSLPSREGSPRALEAQATIGSTSPGSRLLGQVLLPLSPQNGAAALLGAPPRPLLFHTHAARSHDHPDSEQQDIRDEERFIF